MYEGEGGIISSTYPLRFGKIPRRNILDTTKPIGKSLICRVPTSVARLRLLVDAIMEVCIPPTSTRALRVDPIVDRNDGRHLV